MPEGMRQPTLETKPLDRRLVMEFVRVTEAAALAAHRWIGRGNERRADQAAVEAMRAALDRLPIAGRVVIGEGERDEAPMLYIGEECGCGGDAIDLALDPLEGTTLTAKMAPNALTVIAAAWRGHLLHAPDVYMNKIAVGPGLPEGVVALDRTPSENVRALAEAKGAPVEEITVCILDRPRHETIIDELRKLGARIVLIPDGDIAGVIATTDPATRIDMYLGIGGAPEGVLAAAALNCIGGQFEGRLLFRNDEEKARAHKLGITDLDRLYRLPDLASGDTIFAATGVTDGTMLKGVKRTQRGYRTQSVVMRASSGTIRWIATEHIGERS